MAESAVHSVLSRTAVRALDAWTIEHTTPSRELMERAGRRVADTMVEREKDLLAPQLVREPRLLVLAGNGNNGGDGFVVARLLAQKGWSCTVALCCGEPSADSDAHANLVRWRDSGGVVVDRDAATKSLRSYAAGEARDVDVVLDALFGTGLDRPLTGDVRAVVRALDDSGVPVVAVDIPSGLCADAGRALGTAVKATLTVTIGCAKPGLFVGEGPNHVGRLVIADIGLARPADAGVVPLGDVIDRHTVARLLPERAPTTHKGDVGHVLVCGSSPGKAGAVLLGARAALRCGAGLVTMAVPASMTQAVDAALWEAMTLPLADDRSGGVAANAWGAIETQAQRFTAAALGPGLGLGEGAAELVEEFLERFPGRLVIDADALTLIAQHDRTAEALQRRARSRPSTVVLTPHPGEMARLLQTSAADVQADRIAAVRACTARFPGVTLVLKGAATIVADQATLRFNTSGNPGMASPGMGDVLSGMLAALSAVVEDALDAATLAVYTHGLAADMLAEEFDGPGFFASEVADALPDALAAIRNADAR
jgi:hydroxyethylthiazole kinase-like uncharacterized protein yjeF